jgi:Cu/Ag efflux protein CusF
MSAKVEGEVFLNYPDRMKNVIEVDVNNVKVTIQQGFDGKALWLSVMGMTNEINDKESIEEMKENLYTDHVTSLADIEHKDYKLESLGEMKIKGKDCLGIRVTKKGKRDVSLWFDKNSHLLLKSEARGKDPFGQQGEANEEKYFLEYKGVMGIQSAGRIEVHHDGKKIMDLEVTDARYHAKLDDSYFKRP